MPVADALIRARRRTWRWRHPVRPGQQGLNRHQARSYSQYGEDGILAYLVDAGATSESSFVEIGCGDASESNAARLAIERGWRGLAIDADPRRAAAARAFYSRSLGVAASRVQVRSALVTAEDINQQVAAAGLSGPLGMLSIDVDGNDYWLFRRLDQVDPQVAVIEYNAAFGMTRSVSSPYAPDFDRFGFDSSAQVYGASLPALHGLARERGFALVACSAGVNAIFVRRPLPVGVEEVHPLEAHCAAINIDPRAWVEPGWPADDSRLVEV